MFKHKTETEIGTREKSVVEHPSLSFPAEEWVKRSTQHGKSIQRCPIFRKEFAIQPRVLHSCSHRGYIVIKGSKDLREAVPPKDRKLRKQLFDKMFCCICFLGLFPWGNSASLKQNS
ncbi:unnamed protein product [Coccothraustes coccothraustes]